MKPSMVQKYIALQRKYWDEMKHLFYQLTWEEQIQAQALTQCGVWVEGLDDDQYAAYLITRD